MKSSIFSLITTSVNCPSQQLEHFQNVEADELVRIILNETPEAVDVFGTHMEMTEYVREAIASNYIYIPENTSE